ncbi:MAG: hypothetical protein AB4352_18140 [Hormoscilla sp.]
MLSVGFQPTLDISRGFEPTAGQETQQQDIRKAIEYWSDDTSQNAD